MNVEKRITEDNKIEVLGVVGFVLCFITARLFATSSVSSVLLLLSAIILVICNLKTAFCCVFFQMMINDNVLLFSVLSFSFLIDFLFVVKCLFKYHSYRKNDLIILFILFSGQLISTFAYGTQFKDIISLFLHLCIYFLVAANYKDLISWDALVPVGALSAVFGCILSLLNDTREYDWQRFHGIWNDENFCGFYCIIGLFFLLMFFLNHNKPFIARIIAVPLAILVAYTATLTLSRSFVYGVVLLAVFGIFSILRDHKIKTINKIVIILIGAIALYFLITKSFSVIIETRGLTNSTNGNDWTNNRFLYSFNALKAYMNSPLAWAVGVGVDNVPQFVNSFGYFGMATHNTYVDFIVQFGLIQGIIGISYIIKTVFKVRKIETKSPEKILAVVIIIYMAVLTLTQYEFFYLFFGIIEGRLRIRNEENHAILSD